MAARRRQKLQHPIAHPELRAGDRVLVIAGRDKGKQGTVERTVPARGLIVVKGINVAKRHTRASPKLTQGGIIDFDAAIAYSNVQLVCPKCGKATRIHKQALPSGERVNACVRCGETMERTKA